MDVRFINPFMASIKNVFATMLETEILISKPCLLANGEFNADVSAIIGLSGDAVGSVALCLPMNTAVAIASKFVGAELSRDHDDFADALGELANMVAGGAKAKLEGLNVSISLPSVIAGHDLQMLQSKSTPRLSLPCDSQLGRFSTDVVMTVKRQPATA